MPDRIIDIPLESLPFVDEHSIDVAATPEAVWQAVVGEIEAISAGKVWARFARLLGCVHTDGRGKAGQIGWVMPGFVVARAVEPGLLAFMGRHRFSTYALIFTMFEKPSGLVKLCVQTRAEFPGIRGRAYRAAVIGTRSHVVVTVGLLRRARRRAERARGRPPS